MLGELKGTLRGYYRGNGTVRARKSMHPIERTSCFPAIHEAHTRIDITPNHRPSQKWIDELLDAQVSVQYFLRQLAG